MLDFLFTLGQALSALFIVYGSYLTIRQALPIKENAPLTTPALEDELLLLKHIHTDA